MTLERKILIGFIACSLVLLTIAVISFRNSEKFIATNKWVNHTHEVLYELEQILVNTVDAETGMRGYVVTGDEVFLQPFKESRMFDHLSRTIELTRDNPVQTANLDRLEKSLNEHYAHLKECIRLRRDDFAASKALVATGEGKRIEDEIRKRITISKEIEETLLKGRTISSEEDARNFNVIFIVLLIIIVLVLLAVYFIIASNLRALRKAEAETAEKNWSLTGSGDLVKGMQGNKQIAELAQAIINHLAIYLQAQVGAVYITEPGAQSMELVAYYAIDKKKKNFPVISWGEGLVGQAAASKKTILLTEIPSGYFALDTGFGELPPKNIIAVPIIFEDTIVGVIELGSVHQLTELHKQYLDRVADSIAIAITSSQIREKTRLLLEETQRQAEELQVQQEELRQSNEELQETMVLLEKSESELKTQQEELQQSNEELEEKANLLEEQKDNLESTKIEIETKARELEVISKYKSEFLANMSHELRTPLNSILILSQLLSENKSKVLGEKEVEFAKNICNSGTDLLNLINEILDLSKVEAGKMELDIVDVPLTELMADVTSMFSEVAKNKSIDFKVEVTQNSMNMPSIRTDKQRLEQILRNLLSNAFKFTDKGGHVTLRVDRPAQGLPFKNEKLRQVANVIVFEVVDTGIGVPKEKQGIIFEAFQQADGSTKRKYGGTGLGLSICRELSAALGGEIHMESQEDKGSTFKLYLPAQFDMTIVIPGEKPVGLKDKTEKKAVRRVEQIHTQEEDIGDDRNGMMENDRSVLIMEDDSDFARLLLGFIRERGYKGIVAHQGNTGLSYARHYKPDAIILDMKLPVMDGAEVMRQLKNDPDLRHIPVQIISGYDRRKEGMDLGAFDYVRKPVTKEGFQNAFDKIENFVNRKHKKLLIVEDNQSQNNAIRELIGNGDVKCFSAYSGQEAYEMLSKEKFDCTIVDLGLPDMTGFELLEKIRSDGQLSQMPVIVYTGRDLSREENTILNKLANTVVLKTADSHERLLDETILFLHRVESKLPKEKQNIIRKLHKTDEVLKNKKVLVVDDDIRNIYSLTNVLEEEGMKCIVAENGKASLQMLKENPSIDIVLMDVMMPEMDGYEATKEIRKSAKFEKLPIIALTAKAMKGDREKCLAAGMSDYVSKPVNIEQLLSLMRVWLYR